MQESFDLGSRPQRKARERLEPPTVSVSDLNRMVRELIEDRVPAIWVEGEIAGWKRHSSGHRYFCLRDGAAQIDAVMWRSDAQRLPVEPEEGMHVRAFGSVTLYEKRGDYQLVVRRIDSSDRGGLWRLAFERLRTRLEAEGLLSPERKRPLPSIPRTIGVVTSSAGAALQDILHVIARRAPWTRVVLSPARVQGQGAARDIARAITLFQRSPRDVDVIIVGRGGGSVEDLWAFNEEPVARAIADSAVPVVSAVGHEVDVTIADLVADVRAPTPSAAAEYCTPDGVALKQELDVLRRRLGRGLRGYAMTRRRQLDIAAERLAPRMRALVDARALTIERLGERMERAVRTRAVERRVAVERLAAQIDALSPLRSLGRGFAVPLDDEGRILRRRGQFTGNLPFQLRIVDGTVPCRVREVADE